MTTFQETDDFLAHHGVKGMKWGVRRENRIQSLERVGSGTATKRETLRYGATEATGLGVRRNGGLAGSAANKAANMRAVDARRARGEGSIGDFLKAHGGDRVIDTGGKDRDRRGVELVQKHSATKMSTVNSRRENRIQSLERVGEGTASKGEKARYALTEATGLGVRRGGGIPGSAANKAANMRAVDARRARGEGTVSDFLRVHGVDRVIDTGRLDRDLRLIKDNSKPASVTNRQKNARKAVTGT